MPTERPPFLGEVVPTFADRCCVVSATDPPVVVLVGGEMGSELERIWKEAVVA
jgi:hypothetical protein